MFNQSADQPAPDQSPAPIGMRELPPQPAKPMMPAYATPTIDRGDDEARPGPDDSVIARDDHFEGTFTSRGTVRVLGSVEGRIEAIRIRIEDGAKVQADVIVDEAIVAGEFTGNLTCRERLEARPSGRINGRVETHKLMLHEGASVEGEMHMLSESPIDASTTIRGTAPIRGATTSGSDAAIEPRSEPGSSGGGASPSTRGASSAPSRAGTGAPAPTSSSTPSGPAPSSSPASAPSVPVGASARPSGSTTPAGQSRPPAPKPAPGTSASSTIRASSYPEMVRVTPRATTSAGASRSTRNGSGTTTTGF